MLDFIKNKLNKFYTSVQHGLQTLFSKTSIDEQSIKELEQLLIEADVGIQTTSQLIEVVKLHAKKKQINGTELKEILRKELVALLKPSLQLEAAVYLLVGINGSGKTTAAGKIASKLKHQGKKTLLIAADTFRAAATTQLAQWAAISNTDIVIGKENQDPSSVIFVGCQKYKQENYDCLIIDTAGRLQTKTNLMQELAKMKRILEKQLPDKKIITLLTIDAVLGQNSFQQAKLFHECTTVDGVILTKLDGTSKGGIIFAINNELNIPIAALSYGETIDDLKSFDAVAFVNELIQ